MDNITIEEIYITFYNSIFKDQLKVSTLKEENIESVKKACINMASFLGTLSEQVLKEPTKDKYIKFLESQPISNQSENVIGSLELLFEKYSGTEISKLAFMAKTYSMFTIAYVKYMQNRSQGKHYNDLANVVKQYTDSLRSVLNTT